MTRLPGACGVGPSTAETQLCRGRAQESHRNRTGSCQGSHMNRTGTWLETWRKDRAGQDWVQDWVQDCGPDWGPDWTGVWTGDRTGDQTGDRTGLWSRNSGGRVPKSGVNSSGPLAHPRCAMAVAAAACYTGVPRHEDTMPASLLSCLLVPELARPPMSPVPRDNCSRAVHDR